MHDEIKEDTDSNNAQRNQRRSRFEQCAAKSKKTPLGTMRNESKENTASNKYTAISEIPLGVLLPLSLHLARPQIAAARMRYCHGQVEGFNWYPSRGA
jgi:hypothetical protein